MLAELLAPLRIELGANISSKKKALETLAKLFAQSDAKLEQDAIFDALTAREKLGSTALEKGIAIPHCRIAGCQQPAAAVLTLQTGVDFDARDNTDVDLIWALIVPEQSNTDHLQILSSLARLLADDQNCLQIRSCTDSNQLLDQLEHYEQAIAS
mgnify:CR=1 FL=1